MSKNNIEEAKKRYEELKGCKDWIEAIDAEFFFEFAETLLKELENSISKDDIKKKLKIVQNGIKYLTLEVERRKKESETNTDSDEQHICNFESELEELMIKERILKDFLKKDK